MIKKYFIIYKNGSCRFIRNSHARTNGKKAKQIAKKEKKKGRFYNRIGRSIKDLLKKKKSSNNDNDNYDDYDDNNRKFLAQFFEHKSSLYGGRKTTRKPKRTKKLKRKTRKPKRTKKRTRRP